MTGPDDLGGDAWLDRRAPFGSVFAPAVRASTQRIGLAADTLLHPRAVAELQAALLGRLCSLAADGLLVVFRDRLATAGVSPDVTDSAADGRYRRFVTATACDLGHVSDDLPVLGDLVELVQAQWEARTRELIDRLAADEGVLRAAFDAPTGALVSDIDCFLGDPHRNGASVVRLAHDTGATWYHKPRSVDHEADFSATVGALSRHFGGPAPTMTVIARDGHGWMGALEAGTPPDPEQYWRNAGRVAALTHMIGAVDLHHENVVATTWGPIPVDLECVHQPIIWSDEPEPTHLDAPRLLDTVCATGLLPNHYQESSPVALELCGLLARPNQSGGEWRTEWTGLGTDAIATTRRLSTWGSAPNRPVRPRRPTDAGARRGVGARLRRGPRPSHRPGRRARGRPGSPVAGPAARDDDLRRPARCPVCARGARRSSRVRPALRRIAALPAGGRRPTRHRDRRHRPGRARGAASSRCTAAPRRGHHPRARRRCSPGQGRAHAIQRPPRTPAAHLDRRRRSRASCVGAARRRTTRGHDAAPPALERPGPRAMPTCSMPRARSANDSLRNASDPRRIRAGSRRVAGAPTSGA